MKALMIAPLLKAIIQLTEEQSIKIMEINTVQPKLEERFLKEVQS